MSDRGGALIALARRALETGFDGARVIVPDDPWLRAPAAVFVTLRQRAGGQLRGCVGSVEAEQGLGEAVVDMARAAAFRDTRFRRLEPFELASLRIDVSVLSPLAPLRVADESDACVQLERTRPGTILSCGDRSGVFLPKVWDSVPDAREFLRELKIKAGLSGTFWSREIALDVFTCEEWAEAT